MFLTLTLKCGVCYVHVCVWIHKKRVWQIWRFAPQRGQDKLRLLVAQLWRIIFSRGACRLALWGIFSTVTTLLYDTTILIRVSPATRHGLLNWDSLCHSPMSLSLSHKTTSYLLRSQSVNIIVNRSQHVSFKHWSNGFGDVDSLGSVHCFLLSNLSSGCNTPQHKIGIINVTRKKRIRNLILCDRCGVWRRVGWKRCSVTKQIQKICHKGAL